MNNASTPYERGRSQGICTVQDLENDGMLEEAAKSGITDRSELIRIAATMRLAHMEETCAEGLAAFSADTDFARQHRDYYQGLIEASRESLGKLM